MGKRKTDDESGDEATAKTVAEHIADGTWQDLLAKLVERVDDLQARIEKLEAKG